MGAFNLYEFAIQQARASAKRRELTRVATETGLDISWLTKFSLGKIPGASYHKVDQLASYYLERLPKPPADPAAGATIQ